MKTMWLGVVAVAIAACGGAAGTDVLGSDNGGSGGTTQSSGGAPSPTSSTGTTSGGPCTPVTWYRDADGDGFGGKNTQSACAAPGKEWVTKGGDCDDASPHVFPGQTQYFAEPYETSSGARSFDYDCSGAEDEKPPPHKVATPCAVGVGQTCTGDGYVPTQRAGAGVDPLCGATEYQTCRLKAGTGQLACEGQISNVEPTVCR